MAEDIWLAIQKLNKTLDKTRVKSFVLVCSPVSTP
jgi:hypothetical protein